MLPPRPPAREPAFAEAGYEALALDYFDRTAGPGASADAWDRMIRFTDRHGGRL